MIGGSIENLLSSKTTRWFLPSQGNGYLGLPSSRLYRFVAHLKASAMGNPLSQSQGAIISLRTRLQRDRFSGRGRIRGRLLYLWQVASSALKITMPHNILETNSGQSEKSASKKKIQVVFPQA
ncbi:uncharacterized protein RAG0_05610 [Rhynchosporium agropyri]|uniref:Uncharacterized protein n=1 Tax=Rhynchosporium agropyri TaxID=914238 RepID=A0A1E1KDX5_9HELO|nr:uncharacterized protein RAG0_05610 [Rhynchosporium agropyri]